jgi:exonuclease SbcC
MKILHTADWHLGSFRSPVKDGVNLRTEDTKRCLDKMIRVAREERPDYSLISGDIFNVGRTMSDRCCDEIITATQYIGELANVSRQVVVMRGTPNHDGDGQFNVLTEMFADTFNVHVIANPIVL